jgi:DNA-binding NarL/FixJ family response regulator
MAEQGPYTWLVATAAPLLVARPGLQAATRAAPFQMHVANGWDRLLYDVERVAADAVLVDFDAAELQRAQGRLALSGRRLVALLARSSQRERFALVIQTRHVFADIEHLVRYGARGIVAPQVDDEQVLAHIAALIARTPRQVTAQPAAVTSQATLAPNCILRAAALGNCLPSEAIAV